MNNDLRREYSRLAEQAGADSLALATLRQREEGLAATVTSLRQNLQERETGYWAAQHEETLRLRGREAQVTCELTAAKKQIYQLEQENFELRETLRRRASERGEEAEQELARLQEQVFYYSSLLAEKDLRSQTD